MQLYILTQAHTHTHTHTHTRPHNGGKGGCCGIATLPVKQYIPSIRNITNHVQVYTYSGKLVCIVLRALELILMNFIELL